MVNKIIILRINQCIGAKNYKYFLLFLLSHIILCGYSGILGIIILYTYMLKNQLFDLKYM